MDRVKRRDVGGCCRYQIVRVVVDRERDGKSCGLRAYACGTNKSPAGRKRSRAEGGGLYIFRGLYPALHCVYLGDHLSVSTTVVDDWPAFCTVLSAFVSTILLEHG